jgi:hypothetical protein
MFTESELRKKDCHLNSVYETKPKLSNQVYGGKIM